MKEKLYEDLLIRLQAKDTLLRKKEHELLARETRLNQMTSSMARSDLTPTNSCKDLRCLDES